MHFLFRIKFLLLFIFCSIHHPGPKFDLIWPQSAKKIKGCEGSLSEVGRCWKLEAGPHLKLQAAILRTALDIDHKKWRDEKYLLHRWSALFVIRHRTSTKTWTLTQLKIRFHKLMTSEMCTSKKCAGVYLMC